MATDVTKDWQRLRAWIKGNAPEWDVATLPPGATEHQLLEIEHNLGLRLPEDFREFYRLHDGTGSFAMPQQGPLLSLREMMTARREHIRWENDPNYHVEGEVPGIKPVWYSRKRLLLSPELPQLMLDLDPSPEGHYGQLILLDKHEGPYKIVASGIGALIKSLADAAESGGLDKELAEYRENAAGFSSCRGIDSPI